MWYDIRSLISIYSVCRLLAISERGMKTDKQPAWLHIYRNRRKQIPEWKKTDRTKTLRRKNLIKKTGEPLRAPQDTRGSVTRMRSDRAAITAL